MHISFESDMTSFLVSLFSRIRERRSLGFCLDAVAAASVDEGTLPLLDDKALIFANRPPLFLGGDSGGCVGDSGGVISTCVLVTGSEMLSVGDRECMWRTLGSWFIPE